MGHTQVNSATPSFIRRSTQKGGSKVARIDWISRQVVERESKGMAFETIFKLASSGPSVSLGARRRNTPQPSHEMPLVSPKS